MIVKELISELQKINQEAEVVVVSSDLGGSVPITNSLYERDVNFTDSTNGTFSLIVD